MTILSKWVKVNNQGLELDAYLAMPEMAGIYPGVIVIQEIFGVNEHIQEVTDKLASEGYIAIAPAIYQRQAPGFAVGYSEEETKQGREYKVKTQAKEIEQALIQHNVDHQVFRYEGATHGFMCDYRPQSYNSDAAQDAWKKVLDLFSQKL